jgi:hypothetical protein
MGMIGMDELGPMGIRPTGLGLTPIERLQQIAAGQTRQPVSRHPRTRRVFGQPMPSITGRVADRQEPTTTARATGGGWVGVLQRALGWPDRRAGVRTGTKTFKWATGEESFYRGRVVATSQRYNPATGRYETLYRWEVPAEYTGSQYDVTPVLSAAQQRRRAELASRQQRLEQAKAQASKARAEQLAREQAARQDRIRRDRVWREAMRRGWEEDIIQSVLNGSMSYDQANLEQTRRDRQSSQNATGQPYVALPGVPSPPIHVPRRPAVVVQPRPEAGTSVIHQRGTLGPISVGPAQQASAPPGSWQWHQQRTDLEAIKAAAIARSPQARQAYQGQATGAGPTFWLAR